MHQVIGIPRALFYFRYYVLWKTFFDEIGWETVVSGNTNRTIMTNGITCCVSGACLPVKSYFGHTMDLSGRADALFVPRYTSVSSWEYICPKFGGLPDMVRSSFPGLPLISPEINMRKNSQGGRYAAVDTGKSLGVNKARCLQAYEQAVQAYLSHRKQLIGKKLNPAACETNSSTKRTILLMGHPYMVYDSYLNMNILSKLNRLGAEVLTMESYDGRELKCAACGLEKPLFWNYGSKALGCTQLVTDTPVDGIVYLTCFGCGLDSFVEYMVERRLRKAGIPFLTVTLDEHTGEAGLETRLEAFMDTMNWEKSIS